MQIVQIKVEETKELEISSWKTKLKTVKSHISY